MSRIIQQGLNWLIIDFIADVDSIKDLLDDVTPHDWSDYTSAKGENSRQHYLINPPWMPIEDFKQPTGWLDLKKKMTRIVQNEVVHYGKMPMNWHDLHPCSAWTVIGGEGSYHTVHDHGPNTVSSVTYLEVPEKQSGSAGDIFFIMHADGYNPLSVPNTRIFHVKPQKGMIIIFPSWMFHGVYPQGPGIRQTLNMDFNGDSNYNFNHVNAGGSSLG